MSNVSSKLKRPITLALLALACVGWLSALYWWSQTGDVAANPERLKEAEATRSELSSALDRHRQATGRLEQPEQNASEVRETLKRLGEQQKQLHAELDQVRNKLSSLTNSPPVGKPSSNNPLANAPLTSDPTVANPSAKASEATEPKAGAETKGFAEPKGTRTGQREGPRLGKKGAAGGTSDSLQEQGFKDCMVTYDPTTHMTRAEWAATCRRTLSEYPIIR